MANEFKLDGVVPWGREADEYEALFSLADVPETARVLDCAGGPASFTAEWCARGRSVRAVDPLYACKADAIRARFEATRGAMDEGMRRAHARLRWTFYPSEDAVVARVPDTVHDGLLGIFHAEHTRPRSALRLHRYAH